MNERDFTLINDYFNGLLPPEETRTVQDRIAADPAFAEAFALQAQMEAFPRQEGERAAFAASLKTIGADYFKEEKVENAGGQPLTLARSNVRRWMALAASVTLIAAALWFFTRPGEPTYRQYAQHAPLSLTVMGNTEQAKTDAEKAFNQKKYDQALSALQQVLASEPNNVTVQFSMGICLTELNRAPEARQVFQPLAAGNSVFREEAQWYLALTYLKEKNMEACKAELGKIGPGNPHAAQAKELLSRL